MGALLGQLGRGAGAGDGSTLRGRARGGGVPGGGDHRTREPDQPGNGARGRLRVKLVSVFAGEEHEWGGEVVRSEAEVDPRTRVVYAVARVDDPYARGHPGRLPLMIGMYVRVVIPGR